MSARLAALLRPRQLATDAATFVDHTSAGLGLHPVTEAAFRAFDGGLADSDLHGSLSFVESQSSGSVFEAWASWAVPPLVGFLPGFSPHRWR